MFFKIKRDIFFERWVFQEENERSIPELFLVTMTMLLYSQVLFCLFVGGVQRC